MAVKLNDNLFRQVGESGGAQEFVSIEDLNEIIHANNLSQYSEIKIIDDSELTNDYVIDATTSTAYIIINIGDGNKIELPVSTGNGLLLTIKNTSGYAINLVGNDQDLVDGGGSYEIDSKCAVTVLDAILGDWQIMSRYKFEIPE